MEFNNEYNTTNESTLSEESKVDSGVSPEVETKVGPVVSSGTQLLATPVL